MSTTYYPGHLNDDYASIPISAKLYVLHIKVTFDLKMEYEERFRKLK